MSRYCLDTSAYSQFRRGEARVIELLDAAEWIGLPAIVLGELWAGFLGGTKRERNAAELHEFLRHPAVERLDVDEDVARLFGEILVAQRKKGAPVPTNDLWIAATAARAGAPVLTFDAHFESISRTGCLVL